MEKLQVGTLISDNDKLGVITKIIEVGTLDVEVDIINWRANYEIHYVDGIVAILGCKTVDRLVKEKKINIIYRPTTPLPHSPRDLLDEYVSTSESEQQQKKNRRTNCGEKQAQHKQKE